MLAGFGAPVRRWPHNVALGGSPQDRNPGPEFSRREISHNPLKSLVSDERSQGNPSFSECVLGPFQGRKPDAAGGPTICRDLRG